MSLAVVYTRTNDGIHAPQVTAEVDLSHGLPGFSIVGLPETAVKESKDRVRSAIINSGFEFPAKRITVNLAPADRPKQGGRFDLPIAIGILAASGQVRSKSLSDYEFIGELALGGELRPVPGVLPTAFAANGKQRKIVLPADNAAEAALIKQSIIIGANTLLEITKHLNAEVEITQQAALFTDSEEAPLHKDLSDVKGQFQAKRALEIAAAGGHHMLMIGPPGTGKTMLASRLSGILPPMSEQEALESAFVASVSFMGFDVNRWRQRPFREPHHTASAAALIGGGARVMPGEVSLAHHGILFLDELTEYKANVLDVLREPLETGEITLSRAARQATYPAGFQLIAAMNPCPQGLDCDLRDHCKCTAEQQARHRRRISAPFLDRIDLQVEVPRLTHTELHKKQTLETSRTVRERVCAARELQQARQDCSNAQLNVRSLEHYCTLSEADKTLLGNIVERFRLSARASHRILKVSRTIADLAGETNIQAEHIAEAVSYRAMDRAHRAQSMVSEALEY